VLPDGVSIVLRDKLVLQRPMDYDDDVILLRVTSRAEQDMRLRSCAKEPETVAWIRQTLKAGDVLYDIGANVGAYALVAARTSGRRATIYAFEPGYATFLNLVENVFANRCEDTVVPFHAAIGARTELTAFHYGNLEAGGATHGGILEADSRDKSVRRQPMPAYRLDDFVRLFGLRPATHLKIDVDGSELEVLQGAPGVLGSASLQWVLVEVDISGGPAQGVKDLLETSGFRLAEDHEHLGGMTHNWIFRRETLRSGGGDVQ
jgi:FkbM family methyltransferase